MFYRSSSKYGAKKTVNGFPSKLEAAVYEILLLRQKNGELSDIKRQHTVTLQDGPRDVLIQWRIDFSYIDTKTQQRCFCEAKGFSTDVYLLKLKLFRKNPQGRLEIYKGTYKNPKLVEIINAP